MLNHIAVVSGCIFVFLLWDETRREFVRKLRSQGVPVRVLVVVPPGRAAALDEGFIVRMCKYSQQRSGRHFHFSLP